MSEPTKVYLKDYTPPVFAVKNIDLDIKLYDEYATVYAKTAYERKTAGQFVLFGRDLQLQSIAIDGQALDTADYAVDDETLSIHHTPDEFVLETVVKIVPQTNTTLEGLYQAGSGDELMFVTQCEAEGFRKITFFPDRPDVLTEYRTRLEAPKRFKTLLANGNLIDSGELDDDRHFAIWHDPTKKPSYLFACVIANLEVLSDTFTTMEGREVLLEVYATAHDIDKCHVGMQALKDSMKWDEENYGCAYDLDRYMIVATSQFNMGAMENKGLNIFNTSCVLSSPETATDERSFRVKSVIAHEYFHNWTGNRITCRDWFQLCLKEGFTVFRDQSFSGDFRSKAVQRIDDVALLRSAQFDEDSGSLAHPVRPESFVEINNFYTLTIYEKGAEIVRMMATLMGKEKFRQGTDEYFRRYDGQAVTVEDFLSALASADERASLFLPWYRQPGTPVVSGDFVVNGDTVTVNLAQKTRHVAGYDAPIALPIPVDTAIFDGKSGKLLAQKMLLLTKDAQSFEFEGINLDADSRPVVSVLRNFSAPVKLEFDYTNEDLAFLVAHETEGFNRWQALQTLINRWLAGQTDDTSFILSSLKSAVSKLRESDPMLAARLFDLPSQKELGMAYEENYNPAKVKARRDELVQIIADGLADVVGDWYQALPLVAYEDTPDARGRRLLRNILLDIALTAKIAQADTWAYEQYQQAGCMSERFGALSAIINHDLPRKAEFVADFYDRFADEELVIDSWFSVQAASGKTSVADIAALMQREDYDWNTPNRVRTTLGALSAKPVQLWSEEGLQLYLSAIERLDKSNPQVAARMLGSFARWYTLEEKARTIAKQHLSQLQQVVSSKNVLEVLGNMLKDK